MTVPLPLISVVLPVYNGEKFLRGTIQNIQAQRYSPLEIIVVNDGSTDSTENIALSLQDEIKYLYQENQGPAAARNHGIQVASGDLIAFLDVDDLWGDKILTKMALCLQQNPSFDIIQGLILQKVWKARSTESLNQEAENRAFSSETYRFVNIGSSLYRKSVFERVGLFDSTLLYGEDIDWFLRAWEKRVWKLEIEDVVLHYQRHEANMTRNKNQIELGTVQIYKRRLNRIRQDATLQVPPPPNFPSVSAYVGHGSELIN